MKILLIDNYDSFTYNLFHYISKLKCRVDVIRNDKITAKEVVKKNKGSTEVQASYIISKLGEKH